MTLSIRLVSVPLCDIANQIGVDAFMRHCQSDWCLCLYVTLPIRLVLMPLCDIVNQIGVDALCDNAN